MSDPAPVREGAENENFPTDRLDEIAKLGQDWDSYGAPSISGRSIDAARLLLTTIESTEAQVVPTVSGGVQVEWHTADGDLELEILPDGETIDGLVIRV